MLVWRVRSCRLTRQCRRPWRRRSVNQYLLVDTSTVTWCCAHCDLRQPLPQRKQRVPLVAARRDAAGRAQERLSFGRRAGIGVGQPPDKSTDAAQAERLGQIVERLALRGMVGSAKTDREGFGSFGHDYLTGYNAPGQGD